MSLISEECRSNHPSNGRDSTNVHSIALRNACIDGKGYLPGSASSNGCSTRETHRQIESRPDQTHNDDLATTTTLQDSRVTVLATYT